MILGISGKRGTGKSLLAKYLVEIGWREVSFAQELKQRVREDFSLTREHTDGVLKEQPTEYTRRGYGGMGTEIEMPWTPRGIMITYGQYFRSVDPDFWVKQAWRRITQIPSDIPVVVPDLRFPNEAKFLLEKGAMLIRLERDPKLNIYKEELIDESEISLDHYQRFNMILPKEANQFPGDLQFLAKRIESMREAYAVHQRV